MLRDPTIAESAKQRSLRVPLDYAKQTDWLTRGKVVYALVALGIATAYALWLAGGSRDAHRQLSPGRLSNAHATWNDDCHACHRPTQPLRSDSMNLLGRLTGLQRTDTSDARASVKCLHCHQTLNHHPAVKLEDELSCAACHREHQGASRDIARADDANCLRCHNDLRAYDNEPAPVFANVTGFVPTSGGQPPHPDFRSLQSDPGTMKFNHWLHLQPGIAPADALRKLHVTDLPADQQSGFAEKKTSEGLVQLDCAACHEPDSDGRQMHPIAYEQHCRACHPLDAMVAGNERASIPHGLPADQLQPVLDGLLLPSKRRRALPVPASDSRDESGDLPLIPGKTLGKNLAQKIQQDLLGQRGTLAAAVSAKCMQCHEVQSAASNEDILLAELQSSNIPNPWFAHARFDHRAHRHVECRDCHREAYTYEQRDQPRFIQPDPAAANTLIARDNEEVMIPGIQSCATCHAPQRGAKGGARHDCAECHTYHAGTHANSANAANSFPRSPLATHAPEAPASGALDVHFVTFASSNPQVGSVSCASVNCHGSTDAAAPTWQTAFNTWLAHDPHAQAYNVLFTRRSREMTRRLSGGDAELDESNHFRALAAHCTNCHSGPAPPARSTIVGLECESCHGPAQTWLHTHYQAGFDRQTPGFNDTQNLDTRAQTCLRCHASHSPSGEKPRHVVNHDLIAAGHPRLTFDLRTYQASLPAHWDRRADEARHAPAFHFRSWLAGAQQTQTLQAASQTDEPPDFSQLDCFACHHSLRAADWRQPAQLDRLAPPSWPPKSLLTIESNASAAALATVTQRFLAAAQEERRYDAAVQALQCVTALRADLRFADDFTNLDRATDTLRRYLSRDCFRSELTRVRQPGPYDAPSEFDPKHLKPHLDAVLQALQQAPAR